MNFCSNFELIITIFVTNRQARNLVKKYKYSDSEANQFLEEISKNIKTEISFITENEKQPTDNFLIVTRYTVPKKKLEEYNKNGHIKNTFDAISDFATCTIKNYKLTNQNNKNLNFAGTDQVMFLQKFPLWKYTNILYYNIGVDITLNQKFETLHGYIILEFNTPNGLKKETDIPVNISIHDEVTKE